jgi:hypothetical protein
MNQTLTGQCAQAARPLAGGSPLAVPDEIKVFKMPSPSLQSGKLAELTNRPSCEKGWRLQCHGNSNVGQLSVQPGYGLTLPSSGPPPAWPATFLLFMFHFAGQAGSGPLMSNVRHHRNARSRYAVIQIVPYTAAWAEAFESEAGALRRVLGARAIRIDHVGSTAVPGLAAKPVIDIQVSVESLEQPGTFQSALAPLGYKFVSLGEEDLVYPWFAKPGEWPSTHHVHLCVAGEALVVRSIKEVTK